MTAKPSSNRSRATKSFVPVSMNVSEHLQRAPALERDDAHRAGHGEAEGEAAADVLVLLPLDAEPGAELELEELR